MIEEMEGMNRVAAGPKKDNEMREKGHRTMAGRKRGHGVSQC